MGRAPSNRCVVAEVLALQTLADCRLVIGRFPPFTYDARGGGGPGRLSAGTDGQSSLVFAPEQLIIPALNWRTTRFLGLPLPPGLQIAIVPEQLQGQWDRRTGALQLAFRARFRFSIGLGLGIGVGLGIPSGTAATPSGVEQRSLYRAPDLAIACSLSTGQAAGQRHQASGRAVDEQGVALLVGVARVAPSGDPWLDRFLGLPDDALAQLQCRLIP